MSRAPNVDRCPKCRRQTLRMHVYGVVESPASFFGRYSKTNLRKKEIRLQSVSWETASFFCAGPVLKSGLGCGYYRGPNVRFVYEQIPTDDPRRKKKVSA